MSANVQQSNSSLLSPLCHSDNQHVHVSGHNKFSRAADSRDIAAHNLLGHISKLSFPPFFPQNGAGRFDPGGCGLRSSSPQRSTSCSSLPAKLPPRCPPLFLLLLFLLLQPGAHRYNSDAASPAPCFTCTLTVAVMNVKASSCIVC